MKPELATVVPMTPLHLDAVAAVEARSHAFPWTRGQFADSLAAGHWARVRTDEGGHADAFVVVMAGVDEMHLLNVTVDPSARRRGYATHLVRQALQHAAHAAARLMWLEVRPSNVEALAFYERLGFTQRGLRRGYYPAAGGEREDALVLACDVPTTGVQDAA